MFQWFPSEQSLSSSPAQRSEVTQSSSSAVGRDSVSYFIRHCLGGTLQTERSLQTNSPLKKGLPNHWANSQHLQSFTTLYIHRMTQPSELHAQICFTGKLNPSQHNQAAYEDNSYIDFLIKKQPERSHPFSCLEMKHLIQQQALKKNTKMFSLYLVRNDIPQKEGRAKAFKSTQQTVWT